MCYRNRVASTLLIGLIFGFAVTTAAGAKVFDPRTFKLANGMQVVVIENHRAPIVTQMVWYKVGAADEPRGKSGIAHFFEHLMFKATKSLKTGEFSKIVARNGGRDNAFTSYDYTAYHQSVAVDRLELVMKLESDRMKNLILAPAEIIPERQVVLEERRSRTDNRPGGLLREQLNAALYLNYPYRDPVIGWAHEVDALTVEDLKKFYAKWYTPNNAILIVAGDITVGLVRPLAEKYFGVIPRGPDVKRVRAAEPPHHAARRVVLRDPRVRQASWRRSYLAPSHGWGDKKHLYALEVLATVIGSGATSQLYRSLVIDKKIALSAGAFYDSEGIGPTRFGFSATPRPGVSIDQLEKAMEKEIAGIVQNGVAASEVARAKRSMRAEAVYARDSMRAGARVIGAALATGQTIEDVESWPERIAAVSVAQIHEAARAVFRPNYAVTGHLLPQETN